MTQQLSVLFLADLKRGCANTTRDHIRAFGDHSRHKIHYYDPLALGGSRFLNFDEFDVVVLHYSVFILGDYYLHPSFKRQLAEYQGLKVIYTQDDYRSIHRMCAAMREIGVHVLFTLWPEDRIERVWAADQLPGVQKHSTLAGYVPDYLVGVRTPSIRRRRIDIGYRGRTVPYWLGELGHEKTWLVDKFHAAITDTDIVHDVSNREEARIYGAAWPRFIRSCKAMLGTESGSSITDFDDSAETRTRAYLRRRPQAKFREVHDAVLRPYEGNVVINVISPRQFEAIALRTALILLPGEYSGILKPWRHYIPLERDFSNFREVLDKVRDHAFLEELTERTYEEIIAQGHYSSRVLAEQFDRVVDGHALPARRRFKPRYQLARLESVMTRACVGDAALRGRNLVTRVCGFLIAWVVALSLGLFVRLLLTPARRIPRAIDLALVFSGVLGRAWTRTIFQRGITCLAPRRLRFLAKELAILKCLVNRTLHCRQTPTPGDMGFFVSYDASDRVLQFVARPFDWGNASSESGLAFLTRLPEALASGEVRAIEFQHQELGTHLGIRNRLGRNVALKLDDGDTHAFPLIAQLYADADFAGDRTASSPSEDSANECGTRAGELSLSEDRA
jgi:hypothetical protein